MTKVRHFRLLVAGAAVAAVATPLTISALAAPGVGVAVYANTNKTACGAWGSTDDAGGTTYISLCAGEDQNVTAGVPDPAPTSGDEVSAYVEVGYCPADFGDCSYQDYDGDIPSSALTVDPALQSAQVTADIDGCPVDVSFTATSSPTESTNGGQWHNAGADGIQLEVEGGTWLSSPAAGTGSVCGNPVSAADDQGSTIGQGIGATVDAAADTTS